MKISILQENLKPALEKVVKLTNTKTTIAVLNNILLTASDGQLHVSATDLSIGITVHLGCKIQEEGAITLPGRLLTDLVAGLPNGIIDISTNDDMSATIKAGSFDTTIKGIEADEFPSMPLIADRALVAFDGAQLKTAINHVVFAAAKDTTRPVLAGVHLRLSDVLVALEAADGFRLSSYEFELLEPVAGLHDFIVPSPAMAFIAGLINSNDDVVELVATGGQLLFHMEGIDVVTRLIEGEYPDVRSIIPAEYSTRMVLDVQDIVRGVKLADPFAGENDSSTLYLDFSGEDATSILPGSLELTTRKSEIGGYKNTIKGITAGTPNKIMVSNEFFLEALKVAGSRQIAIELQTGTKPLILKEVGSEGWTHVIMQKTPRGN